MGSLRWLGHACFEIKLASKSVYVDPWLNGNPKAPIKASDIKNADIVCVTHDHSDHLGDAFDICKQTKAVFISTYELTLYAQENGVKEAIGLNIGGAVNIKDVNIRMVNATHTSTRGTATGFIINGEGKSVYHAGDTGLFGDMRIIGEVYKPDVALIPIGDYYTMDATEAAEAVKLIKPKTVIPMHYMTFPVLAQTADEFVKKLKEKHLAVKVAVLKPGESFNF
jgi:L-ascorbate metabolism protein UlaG (beta-lactamase superfamily)